MFRWLFARHEGGSVAPLYAVAAIPLLACIGLAIDYREASFVKTSMQGALETTAMSVARRARQLDAASLDAAATRQFGASFHRPDVAKAVVTAVSSTSPHSTTVTLQASGSVKTNFAGMIGFPRLTVSVTADATIGTDGRGCVLALSRTASGAVTGQGGASAMFDDCTVYANSSSATALVAGDAVTLSAMSVGVVGGVAGAHTFSTQDGIRTGIAPIDDPYAGVTFPEVGDCTRRNFAAASTGTIEPGVYCGGMRFDAGADVVLSPGLYVLDGGDLTIRSGAIVYGNGVTFAFTKRSGAHWARATIDRNAVVTLNAPETGPTGGILLFGDRAIPVGTAFSLNGGAAQSLGGVIYLPTGAVNYAGGGRAARGCTQIIGDTVTFSGTAVVRLDCASYAVQPFSAEMAQMAR